MQPNVMRKGFKRTDKPLTAEGARAVMMINRSKSLQYAMSVIWNAARDWRYSVSFPDDELSNMGRTFLRKLGYTVIRLPEKEQMEKVYEDPIGAATGRSTWVVSWGLADKEWQAIMGKGGSAKGGNSINGPEVP